jgi:hypothetical protein
MGVHHPGGRTAPIRDPEGNPCSLSHWIPALTFAPAGMTQRTDLSQPKIRPMQRVVSV